jgi:lysophospholipase L1-like esterase
MFRKNIKIIILTVLLFSSVAGFFLIKNNLERYNYVALGDSIAAGVSPYSNKYALKYINSYPDYIASYLREHSKLKEYTKEFAQSGSTSNDLLNIILHNNDVRERLGKANLITIDIGANDLFQGYSSGQDSKELLISISSNLKETITQIKGINRSVKIYLLGYYDLLPYNTEAMGTRFRKDYTDLNLIIEGIAKVNGLIFISTDHLFKERGLEFLPVRDNVHPNEEGHRLIAEEVIHTSGL